MLGVWTGKPSFSVGIEPRTLAEPLGEGTESGESCADRREKLSWLLAELNRFDDV